MLSTIYHKLKINSLISLLYNYEWIPINQCLPKRINRGYWMSVGPILNLLDDLDTVILCEPLASKILSYSTSSINSVINLHEYNILFITCPK
jgi:hypothetical protein